MVFEDPSTKTAEKEGVGGPDDPGDGGCEDKAPPVVRDDTAGEGNGGATAWDEATEDDQTCAVALECALPTIDWVGLVSFPTTSWMPSACSHGYTPMAWSTALVLWTSAASLRTCGSQCLDKVPAGRLRDIEVKGVQSDCPPGLFGDQSAGNQSPRGSVV
jgi:hypothetical protein